MESPEYDLCFTLYNIVILLAMNLVSRKDPHEPISDYTRAGRTFMDLSDFLRNL